ncbi:TRAP transporter large permease [Paenibacillus hexagrammi]|uniref:TRAP transporter large permease n=1 Tax=Paenibacillus hexagrammi TaxID=2908839 RepID=A0ABY3SNZ5_9BACL|nr:TRAP transporter large permease [Paenibacillus sp. YPD9-1]UJF34855.1 TRAP transporter large permease [Paenibacillus sp. YPD9-1]
MDSTMIAIIILAVSFLIMLVLRFPVALSLAGSTILTLIYLEVPLEVIGQRMIQGVNSYALLTIPFFILAGQIMGEGGLALRLVNFALLIVGRIRGGLAMVNCVACLFFGNISGSAAADVSSIGSIMIPMMEKKGYSKEFSVGLTTSAAIQGVVVPPSHNLILYSLAAGGTSISALFLAGVIPGIILCVALMVASYFMAIKKGFTQTQKVDRKDIPKILFDGILSIMPAFIILGGIFSGWFTASESGAIACLYAFIITFFYYKEIPLSRMWVIFKRTLRTVSMVLFLIAASNAFGWVLAFLKIPALVTDALLQISHNPTIIMLIITVLLLLLGAPMDMAPLILIMTPILLPVVTSLGMDPVHFGIVMMLNLGIGLLTPPVGTVLFIGCAIGKISIGQGARAMAPFAVVLLAVLLLLTYVPSLSMWLPNLMKH